MKAKKTMIDSKVSIHFCTYEFRADACLYNITDYITNKPISNINYILGKIIIYDISPKANIGPSSIVKRKKITSHCYLRTQETIYNIISYLGLGS
jgi:hypothetical protein